MPSRSASRRRGDRYQDYIAAESLLRMLEYGDAPSRVQVELMDADGFDDVVEWYPTRVIARQIKHGEHPERDRLGIESFKRPASGGKTGFLKRCAQGYTALLGFLGDAALSTTIELHVVTNRTHDGSLEPYLERNGFKTDGLAGARRQSLENAWLADTGLGQDEFWRFVGCLRLRTAQPDVVEMERRIRTRVYELGGDELAFARLMRAVADWSEQGSVSVVRSDVEILVRGRADLPSLRFPVIADQLVERDELRTKLVTTIRDQPGNYVVVLGLAGSGKSWLLNSPWRGDGTPTFIFRYNCFTGPANQSDVQRLASADTFARALDRYGRETWPQAWRVPGGPDHERLGEPLAAIGSAAGADASAVLVVDGLDYAQRYRASDAPSLHDWLPRPPLHPGVVIVVSAQVREQLPAWLSEAVGLGAVPVVQVDRLDRAETRQLLEAHHAVDAAQDDDLVTAVWAKFGGHALTTSYAARRLRMLRDEGQAPSAEQVATWPAYDNDVAHWYSRLFEGRRHCASERRLLAALALAPCFLSATELGRVAGVDDLSAEDGLSALAFLLDSRRARGQVRYSIAHDSLRSYADSRDPAHDSSSPARLAQVLRDLDDTAPPDPRAAECLAAFAEGATPDWDWLQRINGDWIAARAAQGARPQLVRAGLMALARAAAAHEKWLLAARWSQWAGRLLANYEDVFGDLPWRTVFATWLTLDDTTTVYARAFLDDGQLAVPWPLALEVADDAEAAGHDRLAGALRRAALNCLISEIGDDHERDWADLRRRVQVAALLWPADRVLRECEDVGRYLESRHHGYERSDQMAVVAASAMWASLRDYRQAANDSREVRRERCVSLAERLAPLMAEDDQRFLSVALALLSGDAVPDRDLAQVATGINSASELAALYRLDPERTRDVVSERLRQMPLPNSLSAQLGDVYDGSRQALVTEFYYHLWLAKEMAQDDCLEEAQQLVLDRVEAEEEAFLVGLWSRNWERPSLKPPSEYFGLARLHVLVGATALLGRIDTWRETAQKLASEIGGCNWPQLRSFRQGERVYQLVMRDLARWIEPLRDNAIGRGELGAFETWLTSQLLPAVWHGEDRSATTTHGVVSRLLRRGRHIGLEEWLRESERQADAAWELKAERFAQLAQVWAVAGNAPQARAALAKACRAALTYGYRKDVTVYASLHGLRAMIEGGARDVLQLATSLGAALVVAYGITDLKELRSTPGRLVSAMAKGDAGSAAALCRALFVDHELWCRPSLAELLAEHEVDVASFTALVPEVDVHAGRDDTASDAWAPAQEERKTFDEVVAELTNRDAKRPWFEPGYDLAKSAEAAPQVEQAESVLAATNQSGAADLAYLAERALELGDAGLFDRLARRAMDAGNPIPDWSFGHPNCKVLIAFCQRQPHEGRHRLYHAMRERRGDITCEGWGVVVRAAAAAGDMDLARAVLDELVAHVMELLAPYAVASVADTVRVAVEPGCP